jgi:hypothetical protein
MVTMVRVAALILLVTAAAPVSAEPISAMVGFWAKKSGTGWSFIDLKATGTGSVSDAFGFETPTEERPPRDITAWRIEGNKLILDYRPIKAPACPPGSRCIPLQAALSEVLEFTRRGKSVVFKGTLTEGTYTRSAPKKKAPK